MEDPEKIYDDLKIETHYDPSKEGYWLKIKDHKSAFFFPKAVLEDYANFEKTEEFMDKINIHDPTVLFTAKEYGISAYSILNAFQETKKIEDGKLEKALKKEDQDE